MFGALIRRKMSGLAGGVGEAGLESTNFLLSVNVPRPSDLPTDSRTLSMLPMGKIVTEFGPSLCRIRSVSAGGLVAEAMAPLPVDTELKVQLEGLQPLPGTVIWVRGSTLGIKFVQDADLRALLANRPSRTGYRQRPPRLEIQCNATVRIGRLFHTVEVRDISLGGIKVALRDPDSVGQQAIVTVESLRPVRGQIRWHKDGFLGIVFDRPLSFEELAEWLGKRLELASLRTGAWNSGRA